MDKKLLKEYETACEVIKETNRRMEHMKARGEDQVQQSVQSSEDYPFRKRTLNLTTQTPAAERESVILKWQVARAEEIKAAVEREMQEAPLRIQRIIQIKYIDGETWEETAARIGGGATAESVRKEIERFLKNS